MLNVRNADNLPSGLSINIANPSAMIIIGRNNALTLDRRTDFDGIHRKHRHAVENMTCDDFLRRLITIHSRFKAKEKPGSANLHS